MAFYSSETCGSGGASGCTIDYAESVPTWLFSKNYFSWTMIPTDVEYPYVCLVNNSGDIMSDFVNSNSYGDVNDGFVVRPVIVISKSVF